MTKPAPLPYKGAPRDIRDLIQRQVNFESCAAHLSDSAVLPQYEQPRPMTWTPASIVAFAAHISRRTLSIATP